jgi:sugar transferase (PEP-CTERM system associated)
VDFYERELKKAKLDMVHPSWILFSDGFSASRSRDLTKRLLDLVLSLSLLAIMSPFIILTAIAVFLETGRPVLYSQQRIGLLGKEFRIYKFRSMRQDAEKDGKARWASANDNRITRVGGFIRNTRLDELPQIYNVIKGEMSFVGPRPERPEFVSELKEKISLYDTRHYVKPGLMGWAQLKYPYGASVEDAKGKLEYDLYYSKNHSLLMDILIMIQTVEVVLLGKGVR